MDSLYCPETDLYRRSEPGSGSRPNLPALPLRGSPGRRPPPSRGSPLHFRPRPPVPRMNRPPGPPWTHRPPFPSPRGPRPPPLGSPRGSPRGMTRGRHPGGRRPPSSRPVSCPPSRPESSGSQTPPPLEDREVTPGKESSSPSDSDLTEVPLSLSLDGKPRHRGTPYTVHYTRYMLYNIHGTMLYIIHIILLYTINNTLLYTIHGPLLYTIHGTLLYTLHGTMLYTIHSILLYNIHGKYCTLHTVP